MSLIVQIEAVGDKLVEIDFRWSLRPPVTTGTPVAASFTTSVRTAIRTAIRTATTSGWAASLPFLPRRPVFAAAISALPGVCSRL